MGDVNVSGKLKITELSGIDPVNIASISKIAPVAAHIKEVNHIDPISIEALHVSQVKNIEPIIVEKFNITDLPMVNMSLRQLPSVDMNIRRLPPVSLGTHQDFHIPSSYTVRARIFGIEFFRLHMNGHTMILPKERYRREQERTQNRSFPLTAAAGNPAIPSRCREELVTTYYPASHCRPRSVHHNCVERRSIAQANSDQQMRNPINVPTAYTDKSGPLNFGLPAMNFPISGPRPPGTYGGSSVSSGG